MDRETARLQAIHVAAQPMAALTFTAGAVEVAAAITLLRRRGDAAAGRAALLRATPLPGTSINRLGYTP